MKPSMFFDEGKEWGRSRRLISPNLNGHNIATMLPMISKVPMRRIHLGSARLRRDMTRVDMLLSRVRICVQPVRIGVAARPAYA